MFDRWLNAELAKAWDAELAKAWDEGYRTCYRVWVETGDINTPDEYRTSPYNPYRDKEDEK